MRRGMIEDMFRVVDASRWEDLAGFYDPGCEYQRPGFATMSGLDAIERFYRDERPIQGGVHRITDYGEDDERSYVFGVFEGVLKTGAEISLRFADHYRFAGGRIVDRVTYFFAPLA